MGSLDFKKSAKSFEKEPKWREIARSGHPVAFNHLCFGADSDAAISVTARITLGWGQASVTSLGKISPIGLFLGTKPNFQGLKVVQNFGYFLDLLF